MSAWINGPPCLDDGSFRSPLSQISKNLAKTLAYSFSGGHRLSFVQLHPSLLTHRGIENVIEAIPEIALFYGEHTGHQMKTAVVVDERIQYEPTYRVGQLEVKPEGWPAKSAHIAFMDKREAAKFATFGSATLVIVVTKDDRKQWINEFIASMAPALNSERVEAVLVVRLTDTSDWHAVFNHFARYGLTIGYRQIRYHDINPIY